jgi:DNA repair ATPase RecN
MLMDKICYTNSLLVKNTNKGVERIEEIAKMIGGDRPSKVAVENAKELLVG